MLFNSFEFIFFFGVVTSAYFLINPRWRILLLLAASCWFYMRWIPIYILILIFTIVVDYFAGIFIDRAAGSKRKLILLISLASNLGVLFVFKYFNFTAHQVNGFAHHEIIPVLKILLPIGLSFHVFQSLAYTIEIYYGRQKPELNFFTFALYVIFYPQLVAGPIERPQNLLPQLHKTHDFDYTRMRDGLLLMLQGFAKKVLIADRLALIVNTIYKSPNSYSNILVLLAAYAFSFQIYCDFSGYSDIAVGAAKVMGFDLTQNFRSPYFADSIAEFWRRWHISLSTWFRDYVYFPLGGNRCSWRIWVRNILIVFLLSGFWHGANWTFLLWGGIHGLLLIGETAFKRLRLYSTSSKSFRIWITFHLVTFAWIFFRAPSIQSAGEILRGIFLNSQHTLLEGLDRRLLSHIILGAIGVLGLLVAESSAMKRSYIRAWSLRPVRFALTAALIILIINFGVFKDASKFIYFQF